LIFVIGLVLIAIVRGLHVIPARVSDSDRHPVESLHRPATLELGDVIHLAESDYKIKLVAVINEIIPQAATT
jgi:hypothetical protein